MINHTHTDSSSINFERLEERIVTTNTMENYAAMKRIVKGSDNCVLDYGREPILIMATGGSKVVAYYLKLLLEQYKIIAEVIEPRDYFYKKNTSSYHFLIAISSSGKTNGIEESLNDFVGDKYLITSSDVEFLSQKLNKPYEKFSRDNFTILKYQVPEKEKSFISLSASFGIMACLLSLNAFRIWFSSEEEFETINDKIRIYLSKSKDIVNNINFNFDKSNIIEIISGCDTKVSSTMLESNLVESGSASVTIHDKGSYCHGRSNLIFQNSNNPIIYLLHNNSELDAAILGVLKEEYPNIFVFNTFDEVEDVLFKEYYLSLQMAYLSRKIAFDRNIDLTQPEYNPKVIRKLYDFKGRM